MNIFTVFKKKNAIIGASGFVVVIFIVLFFLQNQYTQSLAQCKNITNFAEKSYCYEDVINSYAKTGSVHQAFETLLEIYKTDRAFASDCHAYTHAIGDAASEVFLNSGMIEISPLSSLCSYGFYHGFMETTLFKTGSTKKMRDFCSFVNSELSIEGLGGGMYACFHGIGHGIADGSDPRVWGDPYAMTRPTLRICHDIAQGNDFLESRCATGVFNALEILSQDPKYKLTDTIGRRPFDFCQRQELLYREPCYTNMTPAVLRITDNDILKTAQYALEHIERPNDPTVIGGTVGEIAIETLFYEFMRLNFFEPDYVRKGIAMCRALPEQFRLSCIEGLSGGHIKYGMPPGEEYSAWLLFCKNGMLREDERDACFKHVLTRLPVLYEPSVAKKICALAAKYGRTYCKNYK